MTALAATRVGDGPRPVVVLHGFLGSARNVASFARALAAREPSLAVTALDLPGHGASPPLPPRADLERIAATVLEACAPLGPTALVGHSLGGRVALRAALLAPAAVRHVTLLDIGPSPRPPSPEVTAIVDALVGAPEKADRRDVFRAHFRKAGVATDIIDWLLLNLEREAGTLRWRIDREALATLYPTINAEDLWPAIEGPRRYSVHCVRGAASALVSDDSVARLEAAGCRVDTIAGAGHYLHVEQPEATLASVASGLR